MSDQNTSLPSADEAVFSGSMSMGSDVGQTVEFDRDAIIFSEGDDSDFAYIVVEGRIELAKNVEGTEIFLAEIGPGDLFGEMGLIDGSKRSATAVAMEPVVLQQIKRDDLVERLGRDSDFAAPVLNQLVRQLRETSDRMAHEQVINLQRAAESAEFIAPERRGLFRRLTGFFDTELDLGEFQPDAVEIERRKTPAVAKITVYVIFLLMVAIGVWASYSTIDTMVSAMGRITTEVPNIVVQPSETAVIRSIQVKEGDHVEKGQLLATLDATVAEADVIVSRSSLISVLAKEKRLEAEIAGKVPSGGFSENRSENNLQMEIFTRRQSAIHEQLASFDSQIRQIRAEIRNNTQDAESLGEQALVMQEVEEMRAKLMESGHGSRLNYLGAKSQRLSIDREQRRLVSTRERLTHQLNSIQADRKAMLAEWQSGVAEELAATRQERERLTEQLKKTEHRESLVRLTAPAPGIVLKIAERSEGSVITQAEPMFTIVPANVTLEMEADVLPKDVGRIQNGDFVRIKLDALPFQKHGVIEGRVRLISEDAIESNDPAAGSIYRTRVELRDRQLREVPDSFRLTPGLTGSADIVVGKRRIITYFIYPLVRAFDSSFREP